MHARGGGVTPDSRRRLCRGRSPQARGPRRHYCTQVGGWGEATELNAQRRSECPRLMPLPLLGRRARGLSCHLVTGDNWTTARAIAAKLGILDVSAEVGGRAGRRQGGPCHAPVCSTDPAAPSSFVSFLVSFQVPRSLFPPLSTLPSSWPQGPARRQGGVRKGAAAGRPPAGCHGRRRHQRFPGAGPG